MRNREHQRVQRAERQVLGWRGRPRQSRGPRDSAGQHDEDLWSKPPINCGFRSSLRTAHERGWALLTAHPDQYARYEQLGVDLEPLP